MYGCKKEDCPYKKICIKDQHINYFCTTCERRFFCKIFIHSGYLEEDDMCPPPACKKYLPL